MSTVYYLKYSFDTNVRKKIPLLELEYLSTFCASVMGFNFQINEDLIDKCETIPVSFVKIGKFSTYLATQLTKQLIHYYHVLQEDKTFKNQSDLVVIDINANIRGQAALHLSEEIRSILNKDTSDLPRFVVIVGNLPSIQDDFYSIRSFITSGKVILIDRKRRVTGRDGSIQLQRDFRFEKLSTSAIDKIRFKFVRKIGHFGRFDKDKRHDLRACNLYFYDGADCTSDLSDALFERILELDEKEGFKVSKIVYYAPESLWLRDSLTILKSDLTELKSLYDFRCTDLFDADKIATPTSEPEQILFIVPLIHSGNTFKKLYKKLKPLFPNSQFKFISILISNNGIGLTIKDRFVTIPISEIEEVEVSFMLSVSQKQYPKFENTCPMCNELEMDVIKDTSYVNDGPLTSFETWTMCDEVGYSVEDLETARQEPFPALLPLKPRSLNLIKNNAALLALKYFKQIEVDDSLSSSDLILVFPDETTNEKEIKKRGPLELEDTASGYFAESLIQLKRVEYFGIPRNIIEKLKDKKSKFTLSDIQKKYPEFYSRLSMLTDDIIIMDEFGLSGGTVDRIVEILSVVDKKPKAYFPIFNFNPRVLNESKWRGLRILSLYDFNINWS